jgi:hypothetical protein
MKWIAEGVEKPQQRDYLQKQMCPEMQGFLFSRPLTAADCSALLRSMKHGFKHDPNTFGKDVVETEEPLRVSQVSGRGDNYAGNSNLTAVGCLFQ